MDPHEPIPSDEHEAPEQGGGRPCNASVPPSRGAAGDAGDGDDPDDAGVDAPTSTGGEPRRKAAPSNARDVANLHRLLRIIMLVQAEPRWAPTSLAEHFGIEVRTLHRDIKKLKGTGVPISFDPSQQCYVIQGSFFLQPVQLAPEEALALAALCSQVAERELIGFMQPAARAMVKILSQLPSEMRDDVNSLIGHMSIRTGPTVPSDDHADVYEKVRQAIAEQIALDCEYEPASRGRADDEGEAQRFEFEPYALFFGVRAWYAIGRRSDRDDLRSLKLSRFGRLKLTSRSYTIPPDFSIDAYLGNAWQMIRGDRSYDVEIAFGAEIADRIAETLWHRTQSVERHEDGSATFRCTVDGLDEIVWWVLSMGPSARVVQPAELAVRVAELARRTAAQYAT